MSEDIVSALKENVIQGRKTAEDEGIDEELTGAGVLELTQQALDQSIPIENIITEGLTAGMQVVGEKFSAKEYFIREPAYCSGDADSTAASAPAARTACGRCRWPRAT